MHKTLKKLTRAERSEINKQRLENSLFGTGRFVFQNNTSGELVLAKAAEGGVKRIQRGGQFIGDSYFKQFVPQELRIIEVLGEIMPEKLITEQPPIMTPDGKVEFVQQEKALNEDKPEPKQNEVLLTEEPLGSIVIFD